MASERVGQPKQDRGIKLYGVQVKLAGENLEVFQEYDQKLELDCVCVEKGCNVSLCNGEIPKCSSMLLS